MNPRYATTILLAISAALLASLIPGGPIENRDFSHIHPAVLAMFNVFLTALDITSLAAMPFTFKGREWANKAAFAMAIAYFVVYALDLAQLFPRSPTAMSPILALIEVLGMTVAVPLMFYSRSTHEKLPTQAVQPPKRLPVVTLLAAGTIAVAIVVFATYSAMNSGHFEPPAESDIGDPRAANTSTHTTT